MGLDDTRSRKSGDDTGGREKEGRNEEDEMEKQGTKMRTDHIAGVFIYLHLPSTICERALS